MTGVCFEKSTNTCLAAVGHNTVLLNQLAFKKIFYICFMKLIDANRDKLIELCERHKVKELYFFGSVLTDKFEESSDIDILIQFYQIDLMEYFDNYMDFKDNLEKLFKRPVDLVENQAIRNPIFRKVIDREKLLFYERKNS